MRTYCYNCKIPLIPNRSVKESGVLICHNCGIIIYEVDES